MLKDRLQHTHPLLMALCTLAFLLAVSGSVRAAPRVTEERHLDRSLYILENDHLRVVVDPVDGACVSMWQGAESPFGGQEAKLIRDSVGDEVCAYGVNHFTQTRSFVNLSLSWGDRKGLRLHKTFTLLDSELALRVTYRIENASQEDVRVACRSVFPLPYGEHLELRVMEASGLSWALTNEFRAGKAMTFRDPRWLCVAGSEGRRGVMMAAGAGMLEVAEGTVDVLQNELTIVGQPVSVPAGKILQSEFNLAAFQCEEPVVGIGQGILVGMDVDTAGRTVRVKSCVVPLADLGLQALALSFKNEAGEELRRLQAPALQLTCGKPERFTFYWEAPDEGSYTCELLVPGRAEWPLSFFQIELATGALLWLDTRQYVLTMSEVEGWRRVRPAPTQRRTTAVEFYNDEGERITGLSLHLGMEERETAVFDVEVTGLGEEGITYSISECIDPRQNRGIPQSSVSLEMLGCTVVKGETAVQRPKRFRFALRTNSFGLGHGEYYGEVRVAFGSEFEFLPVLIRVWPVYRPEPGLVRLHSYSLQLRPGSRRDMLPQWRWMRAHRSVALPFAPGQFWRTDWVRLLDWGLPVLPPATPFAPPPGFTPLPHVDFSEMDPWINDLVLVGMLDFVLVMDLTQEQVAPMMSYGGGVLLPWEDRARWFWREFNSYLRTKGFQNLYVVTPRPVEASQIDWEWSRAASLLSECGWSVCGPYTGEAVQKALDSLRGGPGKLLLIDGRTGEIYPSDISVPEGVEKGVWLPVPEQDLSYSQACNLIRKAWRPGVSVLAIGPGTAVGKVAGGSNERVPQGPASGEALKSVLWEALRDGMDEVNYLAMLDWYLGQAETDPRQPMEAIELAGKFRTRLKTLLSREPDDDDAASASGRLNKRAVLEMLSRLRELLLDLPHRLYWNDILLVDGRQARAEIVVEGDQPMQMAQAKILREMIKIRADVSLPVVEAERFSFSDGMPVAIVLATDLSHPVLSALLDGQHDEAAELALRLERSKHLVLELRTGAYRRYVVLLGTNEEQLGRAVMSFKMRLRQQGGWLAP